MTPRRPAAGFSLVEVLVSMLVVTFGVLALAGLLQASARHARMSEQRVVAALMAGDIADRIRANPAGAALAAAGYDLAVRGFPSPQLVAGAECSGDSPCGPGQLARAELAAWTARLRATLPGGSAVIRWRAGAAPAPGAADVWVGWADAAALPATDADADRSGTECPDEWRGAAVPVRCIHLQVAP